MSSSSAPPAQMFRLSPQQRRLWALAAGGDGPYRALALIRIDGPLDPRALEAALANVVARHEILRTTFPRTAGMSLPGQAVHDEPATLRLERRDGLSVEQLWEELAARPFRLDREPPLAAVLAELTPESHVLLLAVHALCADEAALGILVRDLRNALRGEPREPPVQYADVAAALEEMLESEESEAGRRWWREILPDVPPAGGLPFESEAGAAPFAPRWVEAALDPGLTLQPTVALAAWQSLLARLAPGMNVMGVELAGRHYEGFETALGAFARTVPVRVAVRAGEPFAALAARLEEQLAALADWQDYFSWDAIPGGDAGFFPAVFCWKDGKDGNDWFRLERAWACTDRFLLRLTIRGAWAELAYDAARFRERDARRLLASLVALLESAVAAPWTPVGDLELVGPEDRRRLLVDWNATERPFEPVPIHELFFEQARRTPENIALSTVPAGESLTYVELARRVTILADSLRRAGVGPDVPVAIFLERSVEMVVGVLAILTAGGAYVPLDPSYPPARLAVVLEASGAPVVLEPSPPAPLPQAGEGRGLAVSRVPGWSGLTYTPLPLAGEGPGVRASSAYILFTSGSTGTPKGVVVCHRALTNHMFWMQEAYSLTPGDRVLQKTPLGFDASVWEIFAPLLAGAELVLAEPEAHRDPARLARALAESGGTILQVVPSLLRLLLGEEDFVACSSLRRLFCGGEPLTAELRDRVHAVLPGVDLINLYGPTETTVQVVTWTAERSGSSVPIGRPIHNARIYLLDAGMRLVPPGLPGELWIGGEPLARGYLGRPDLTAASFRPDPFSAAPGSRLYQSGNLARYREDGALLFLGRVGREVKIRGYRFDRGEIEDLLGREPGVREAAVAVREDRLVAWVAPGPADPAALRAHLAEHLPDFLIPSAFVPLPALPRTPGGKLDRAALPEPSEAADAPRAAGFAAPRTAVEQVLAEIWADLLRRERVGLHDDFFELGGHSLIGVQLVARVRQVLGVELSLRTIFEAPTVAGLAAQVTAAWDVPPAPPIERVSREGEIPLSFAQQRLWVLERLAPGDPSYHGFSAARFTGRLDERALLGAFREIVRVQETLRTTFPDVEGRPVQHPAPALALALPVIDLQALPEERRLAEARRLAHEEARRPFDLAAGPLLRLALLRLGGERSVLFTAVHHIVSDAWSIGLVYRDLMKLYTGEISRLPEPPVQYIDYAVLQRRWFEQVRERELDWWRRRLADLPTLRLPTDRPRSGDVRPTCRGITLPVAVPTELSERLRRLARAESVTPFMLLLAGFQALLARWSGQDDVVVGVPVAHRERAEIEDLVGFFVNLLVLRTSCAGDPTMRELLARVREGSLGAFTHQSTPFEMLVDELAPERDPGLQPFFQVMFQLQTAPVPRFTLPGLAVDALDVDPGATPFDLVLDLRETPEGLAGVLQASRGLFDPSTLGRLLGHLRILLEGLTDHPELRLAELPLLSGAERHQITVEWNDTARPYETGRCLHELFAAQAERTPLAVAAVFEGASLTYRDLLDRSRSLARHLRSLGVEAGDRVSVLLERSLEMIAGLLGVLMAGAAYVPLNPALPPERLALLLESAGIGVVLTQERHAKRLPGRGERAVLLDRSNAFHLLPVGRQKVDAGVQSDAGLAYVIYTSGSTGTPKGVMIPHRGIVNRLLWMQEAYALTPEDRVLQKTPFSFDVSLWELFWPLLTGARLVLAQPEGHQDPLYLVELIAREKITTLHFVPSMLRAFLAAPGLEALTTVRQVMASGEALPPELVRRFFQRLPHARLHNLYGPTEASVDVSFWACEAGEGASVPIGRPIANHRLHVVDRHLEPQPIGVHGELLLGGPGLARGYLGRPDLTAAAFVPDPFGTEPGGRLYRTGDLVRQLPDGNVLFLGRIDHQVKIRGFRIEVGEIEAVLAAHPAVRECVVMARQDGSGETRLVAYVVAREEPAPEVPQLQAYLGAKLPACMIPGVFVVLPALPLSPNGKVDRKALPTPNRQAPVGRAPKTSTEVTLARIWAEVLHVEDVSVQDSFFALGGDSILGIQVAFHAREAGLALAPRDIFRHHTLGELAAAVAPVGAASAADPEEPGSDLPLTPIQHWFFDLDLAEPHHYNQALVLGLRQRIDPALLERALASLVERHTALRLRFDQDEGGGWRQKTAETVVPVDQVDLSPLPAAERRAALDAAMAWLQASLHLAAGPLLRVALFDLGDDLGGGQRLFLVLHHLIVDGVSWRILLADLESAYRALAAGIEPILCPTGTSLARWGARLAEEARSAPAAAELGFWLSRNHDIRPLPTVRTVGENTVVSARQLVAELGKEHTRALLQDVPARYPTEINDILLTALVQAFAGWTGEPRLLLDLEGHGREDLLEEDDGVDLSRTMGWLTALYPVVLELDPGERDPGIALRSIQQQLRAVPRKGLGYGILRHLGDEATVAALAALPAPQILFNYMGQLDRVLPESSLFIPASEPAGSPVSPRQKRPWLLEISGGVVGGRLLLFWTYGESHDARTIQGVIDRFLGALRALIEHCRATEIPDQLMAGIGGRWSENVR